ncbi:extracytoplasmic binding receptor [Cupriavidus basilensis OR16]|uniref:Extracytoplasmic binding receptor n=1 Tax=Cupriavidus basilensis OR16 TaxID=1127483 RepID=H1SB61_9BURK|nr:tripartite tricarboxylate transporter substrate binding protein [Cupriavidus basilensis]EHP40299.1 extracytoplasmic binding receptor [Cupriavidus basilensis OR16]
MIAIALALLGCTCAAAYPDKPIRILVGLPSGSLPDTIARVLGARLSAALGVPVLVENITGAAGNIASERLAKAVPDGYTLGVLSQTQIVVNPSLYALPFDPQKAFAPISQLTLSANVLVVNSGVPAKTVSDLVALAKAQPGMLTFASGGIGSGTHLAGELFQLAAGIDMRHVPYKGVSAAIPDLLAGRVSLMFSPIQSVLPWVRDGRLRALAVTSLKRASVLPELPTVAESGFPGFEVTLWSGLVAPAGTPSEAIRILHAQTVKALAAPEVRDRLAVLGIEEMGNSPQEFAAAIKTETPKWAKVIGAAGIKAN